MEDYTIRPSMKTTWIAYLVAFAVMGAAAWAYMTFVPDPSPWPLAGVLVALLVPIRMHVRRRLMSMRLHDNHLTIESGFFSRMRRTVDMAKIQDVTVRQSFGQRLLGVGDLTLESAGESSGMGMRNVDSPRRVADEIIAGSKRAAMANLPPGPRTI